MTDKEFNTLIDGIYGTYKGQGDKLTHAIGSAVTAHYMGWRVLLLMTSESTFRNHQKTLGIDFKELFEERGRYAHRSFGLKVVDKLNSFWKVVQGREKMEKTQKLCIE